MREIIRGFREAIPRLTVRTTVLVGFPGESEAAFTRLLEFVEEMRFDRLGVFTHSPEEGTAALELPNAVPSEIAEERAAAIQELQERMAWEQSQRLDGTLQRVLVDGPSQDPAFGWEGRTAGQAPEIDGVVYLRSAPPPPAPRHRERDAGDGPERVRAGQFVDVRVTAVEGYELVGECV
jgi:ribosomal protein S12 methylthiotransferase